MNIIERRLFLKKTIASLSAVSGLMLISPAILAKWPEQTFHEKDMAVALKSLLGASETIDSTEIKIKAPDIAENGAVVPVTISSDLPASSIVILAPNNPSPLISHFELGENALPYVSTRIKMGKTGDIVAIIKVNGKLYTTKKTVKVTIGGCGG